MSVYNGITSSVFLARRSLLVICIITAVLLCLYSALVFPSTTTLNFLGIKIPKEMTLDGTQEKTLLQGYAANFVGENPLYVGAFFTSKIQKEASLLLLEDLSMAMVFFFLQDDVSAEKVVRIFTEELLLNNPGWDQEPLNKDRLKELEAVFQQTINSGDKITFEYSSSDILTVSINGKVEKSWKNSRSLFNALLKIWIGSYPPNRAFKENILGKEQ